MKRYLLIIALAFCTVAIRAQENSITLSGGYVFGKLEDIDENADGWRINGSYEFSPMGGNLIHGLSAGYMVTSASQTGISETSDYSLSSWPIYYTPKYIFGKDSFKGFVKGALGIHFSNLKIERNQRDVSVSEMGFIGGAGLGFRKYFGEKIFLNIEYEFAFLSHSSYKNGIVNSAMGGIGIRF